MATEFRWESDSDYQKMQVVYTPLRQYRHRVHPFNHVVQVETIDGVEECSGHILMTNLFSGFTIATASSSMDQHMVIDTFFSLWVIGLNSKPSSNYVYTSSGRKLDTKEGRELCEDCKGIFQDL